MKQCQKCLNLLNYSDFHKNTRKKDGFQAWCVICSKMNRSYPSYNERNKIGKRLKLTDKERLKMYNSEHFQKNNFILKKLKKDLRHPLIRIIKLFNINKQSSLTEQVEKSLGCKIIEFIPYMEKQFKSGMSWSNHGKWHIDHIFPLSKAKNIEHAHSLCHYTNLQPLWAIDNIKKGAKIL